MLGYANLRLGILVMARCSMYKYILRHARCQGMLVIVKACQGVLGVLRNVRFILVIELS